MLNLKKAIIPLGVILAGHGGAAQDVANSTTVGNSAEVERITIGNRKLQI